MTTLWELAAAQAQAIKATHNGAAVLHLTIEQLPEFLVSLDIQTATVFIDYGEIEVSHTATKWTNFGELYTMLKDNSYPHRVEFSS